LKTKYPAKQYVISPILQGGLGNRMFQIASGFGVAQKQGKSLFITGMAQNAHSSTDYFKSIFRNVPRKAMEIQAVFQEPQESALEYLNIPNEPIDMLMLGYMQSPKYFEEYRSSILDMFAMASEQKAAILAKYPDVGERYFLHVRRGDYLKLEMHNIDLMDYYHRAIQFIGRDAKYLVCSDDIAWCKTWSELEGVDVMFIEDDEVMTLYTMSMCSKGGICANSSFSWWGAYLNQNSHKRVVFPDKWFNNSWKNEIYPESSIIVSVRDLV
jgi:hypothetical protein